jgi:hypothetical protein
MGEKEFTNVFRFSLYQGSILLGEKAFDADQFNPFTRYSIDIRDILPKAITRLQKTLSKKSYDVIFEVGREDVTKDDSPNHTHNLYQYYQSLIHSPCCGRENYYNPQPIVQHIEEKVIRGVECKIGFYINNKPIVERMFYVDGFNPVSRWSLDVLYAVIEIADQIFTKIKRSDIRNMWDDYVLINYRGYSINQIREFSPSKREDLLRKLNSRS